MTPTTDQEAIDALAETSRPMIGFWATLTPEQQRRALAYRGDESFGEDRFRLRSRGFDIIRKE